MLYAGWRIGSRSSSVALANNVGAKIRQAQEDVNDLENGLLIGAGYDGERRLAVLKFYDVKGNVIRFYFDKSGHKPYCYSKQPPEELQSIKQRPDVEEIVQEEKKDLINDRTIVVSKIITKDPLAIGGGGTNSIRDTITAYEADIKYYENYVYDRQLQMGAYFRIKSGRLEPLPFEASGPVMDSLKKSTEGASPMLAEYIKDWALLLTQPYPFLKRAALDIEVYSPEENRLPDPKAAEYPVISVALVGNDGKKKVFVLERSEVEKGERKLPEEVTLLQYRSEGELLLSVFDAMLEYPIIVTFNGDGFDLPYLYNRAIKLELQKEAVPISMGRDFANIKHGLHMDLYKAFNNKSIQIYAFSNRYSDHTLNGIASALLGREKVELEEGISMLPLGTLSYYNYIDAEITLELTTFNSDLVMRLFLTISRISKMPIEDACRLNVSNWIKSLLIWEHRKWNALVPRKDDLEAKGSASSEAIIKGKKYKGGLVIEPLPGVHFNAVVLDFASLYPSIIKVYNLSYETVNCVHPECRTNRIPETDHWVCRLRTGITSLLIGSLRDVRVGHFKNLSKKMGISKQEKEFLNVISQSLKVFLNACFTGDTEILTTRGTKNIKDVMVGDRVINVNPVTLKTEVDEIVEVQAIPYDGPLYHFEDEKFVDLRVTPNHRMLVVSSDDAKRRPMFRTAEEVYSMPGATIPETRGVGVTSPITGRISILESAQRMNARIFIVRSPSSDSAWSSGQGARFADSPDSDRHVGNLFNPTEKAWSFPARSIDEGLADALEAAGYTLLVGDSTENSIPLRFDMIEFASLCGNYFSEGCIRPVNSDLLRAYPADIQRGQVALAAVTYGSIPSVDGCDPNYGAYQASNTGEVMFVDTVPHTGLNCGTEHVVEFGESAADLLKSMKMSFDVTEMVPGQKRVIVKNASLVDWIQSHFYGTEVHSGVETPRMIPRFILESVVAAESFLLSAQKPSAQNGEFYLMSGTPSLTHDLTVLIGTLGRRFKLLVSDTSTLILFGNHESILTFKGNGHRKNARIEKYSGMVYCVTTAKNHTVFAGRSGRFVPVGQSYGVMGFESFALYCLPVAEATAALGRYSITKTIDKARSVGIQVAYGDTDSLFLKSPSKEQVEEMLDWAKKELGIELEIDKVYRYAAFSGRKKNYLGVYPDGSVEVKGLTGKKSNVPEFIKVVFKQVLNVLAEVQTPEDFERAREKIRELLRTTYLDLKARKIPIDQLAFHVMMNKPLERYLDTTPQHVKAAQYLKSRGREIKSGEIISFVKTSGGTGVKPAEFTKPEDVDVDKYVEYLRGTFDQLLDALGYEFDEILGARKLEDFFFGG